MYNKEYFVILGNIEDDAGVTNSPFLVIPIKLAAPTSSIFVWVAGSKYMQSAYPASAAFLWACNEAA